MQIPGKTKIKLYSSEKEYIKYEEQKILPFMSEFADKNFIYQQNSGNQTEETG
jgi:hypothetical protein